MKLIFRLYIAIINLIGKMTIKIPANVRIVMINISLLVLSLNGMLTYSNSMLKEMLHLSDYSLEVAVMCFIVLFIASIDHKVNGMRIRGNNWFWIGWILCYVTMVVSNCFHHSHERYVWLGLLCISVIPMIIIVWYEKNECRRLYFLIARSAITVSYVFFALNLILLPFMSNKNVLEGVNKGFAGTGDNPNGTGLICLAFFAAALYLVVSERKLHLEYLLSLSISTTMIVMSGCRTASIVLALSVFITPLFLLRCRVFKYKGMTGKRLLAGILIFAVIALSSYFVFQSLEKIDLNAYASTEYDEAVEFVESNHTLALLNYYSSGRILLWRAYLGKVAFLGHGTPAEPIIPELEASIWAHNNALDIWYASGFPAFIGYALWILCCIGFLAQCVAGKHKLKIEYLFPTLCLIGYIVEAMLEITIYPTHTGIVLMAFLSLAPVAFKEIKAEE